LKYPRPGIVIQKHNTSHRRFHLCRNMTVPKIWALLAWGAAAAASPALTRHQTIDSSFLLDIQPTKAVLSRTIVEEATFTTRVRTYITTSSVTVVANVEGTKPKANPEPVEGRTAADLDPSLQIVFLVLRTLFGLASVVVAIFFGHKQLSITTNQSNANRTNHSDDDVELGRLNVASGESHIITDLTTHNSHTFDVAFIRTLASGMVHVANELKYHLVAVWSSMRHPDELVLPSVVPVRPEPPKAGHQQQMHPAEPHD
jgi:hypothetical protein